MKHPKVFYEWLPDNSASWKLRHELADIFLANSAILEQIWADMPACKCLNVLVRSVNTYQSWALDLRDRRRRKVPMVSRADWELAKIARIIPAEDK